MIELTFGESPAGALKLAKSRKQGENVGGAVAVFGGTENERREAMKPHKWSGMTMEGSSKDVIALTLELDIGDISEVDSDISKRRKVFNNLFMDFPEEIERIEKQNQYTMLRLQEAKTSLEPIRMWISTSDPAEMCGMYFICHLMSDSQTPLSVVSIPTQVEKDNCIIWYRSTGEVDAEKFGVFTEYEEAVSGLQRSVYAGLWRDLVLENAPLRAIINGCVISVPIEFYDFTLLANISEEPIRIGQVIGKIIGQVPGVGDRLLYLRIEALIQSGEFIKLSVGTGDHPYSVVIKRNDKKSKNFY